MGILTKQSHNIINKMCQERNITKNTARGYKTTLNSYEQYHKMTIKKLLQEAEQEEENNIPLKKRKIRNRILDYRTHIIQDGYAKNTVKNFLSKIHTFYTHHDITIPTIPSIKLKDEYITEYNDLPTKEDIRKVCDKTTTEFKALILFMSSSGTAKAETLSLTINDFIKATKEYHNTDNIGVIISQLRKRDDVVPTWYIKRRKTNKFYHTFSSPESTRQIVNYLSIRNQDETLDPTMKLFSCSSNRLTKWFEDINDEMGWGFKGYYRFFRSHVLRKFHASNIGLPTEYIDALQGRSKNKIHQAYIKTNPTELKKMYIEHMENIMIYEDTTNNNSNNPQPQIIQPRKSQNNNQYKIISIDEKVIVYDTTIDKVILQVMATNESLNYKIAQQCITVLLKTNQPK